MKKIVKKAKKPLTTDERVAKIKAQPTLKKQRAEFYNQISDILKS